MCFRFKNLNCEKFILQNEEKTKQKRYLLEHDECQPLRRRIHLLQLPPLHCDILLLAKDCVVVGMGFCINYEGVETVLLGVCVEVGLFSVLDIRNGAKFRRCQYVEAQSEVDIVRYFTCVNDKF